MEAFEQAILAAVEARGACVMSFVFWEQMLRGYDEAYCEQHGKFRTFEERHGLVSDRFDANGRDDRIEVTRRA